MSYLSPQYGLACDSFRDLEIVLPSGETVTASASSHPDLFFASRGGGGNAHGVVTKYTAQSRSIGALYAGNIIYVFPQKDTVIEAIGTYEKLPTPDLNLNLDEAVIMFLVYHGPDPGTAFDNFTSIPHLLDSTSIKTYPEVVNMPIPLSTELWRGNNIVRVGVHRPENASYALALDKRRTWAESNKGK